MHNLVNPNMLEVKEVFKNPPNPSLNSFNLEAKNSPKGRKFDQGKPRYSLLPSKALREVVKVLTFGSTKYEDFNWKYVDKPEDRYFSAGQRHQWDWMDGIILDEENKCHHLACAITNLMFILDIELNKASENEISKTIRKSLEKQT